MIASALLAMFQGERGGSQVARVIAEERINVVNYTEVVSHFIRLGMPAADIDAMLDPLPVEIVPVDKELGKIGGHLRGVHRRGRAVARRPPLSGPGQT